MIGFIGGIGVNGTKGGKVMGSMGVIAGIVDICIIGIIGITKSFLPMFIEGMIKLDGMCMGCSPSRCLTVTIVSG